MLTVCLAYSVLSVVDMMVVKNQTLEKGEGVLKKRKLHVDSSPYN